MPESNGEERWQQLATPRRRGVALFLLLGAILIGVLVLCSACSLVPSWNSTQWTGYGAAILILAIGLLGPRIAKNHLVHHQIFRFMAYCALFIFILTLCYSMYIDIKELRSASRKMEGQQTEQQQAVSGDTSHQ